MGKQFSEFRIVSGGEQGEPVQRAGDGGPPGRQRIALAGPAGDPQIRLVEASDETEAGAMAVGFADQAQQGHGTEFAVDDPCGFELLNP